VFVVAGIVKIFGTALLAMWPLLGLSVLCISHVEIAYNLRHALGEKPPDSITAGGIR